MKIAVACGGTGGHIFPGLAVADVLCQKGHDVTIWLGGRGVESVSVAGWYGSVERVNASGFSSGLSVRTIVSGFRLISACWSCWRRMRRQRPDVLLAMGSYASVGPAMACHFLGIPIVLHEANAVPGKAVSFLARFASVMAFGFPEAVEEIGFVQAVVTGFPVRTDLESHFEDGLLDPDIFTILVMGGSQGSEKLDDMVSRSICKLRERGMALQVVHLARPENESKLKDCYRKAGVRSLVFGFLKEMGKAYCAADFVIARAGAATCAELSACGLPALLIPLPSARRDHQTVNARSLEKRGGVDVIVEKDLSEEWFVDYVEKCASNPEKLSRMAQAQKECAVPDSAEKIAELVLTVGSNGKRVNSGR